jgi:hypothetical protein
MDTSEIPEKRESSTFNCCGAGAFGSWQITRAEWAAGRPYLSRKAKELVREYLPGEHDGVHRLRFAG